MSRRQVFDTSSETTGTRPMPSSYGEPNGRSFFKGPTWNWNPDPYPEDVDNVSLGLTSPKEYSIATKCIAEFLGDFTFVFVGIMQSLNYGSTTDGQVHAALAHGIAIFVVVSTLGHISGGHFNPAVTLSIALTGKMPLWHVPLYWCSQLFGGFCAALMSRACTRGSAYNAIMGGCTLVFQGAIDPLTDDPIDPVRWWQALLCEAIVTFFLCHTVLNTAVDTDKFWLAPLAIGFTLTIDIFAVGDLTGASMNPARSFGPNIAGQIFLPSDYTKGNFWHLHYVYWVGPFVGATVAAAVHRAFEQRELRFVP